MNRTETKKSSDVGKDLGLTTGEEDDAKKEKNNVSTSKAWGSWAQALYHVAMHPEMHKNDVMEISDDIVILNYLYPKAKRHLLLVARIEGLDRLADASKDHL